MTGKLRLTIVRGDEVVAMRTFPLKLYGGRSSVLDMDMICVRWFREIGWRPQLDDELHSEVVRPDPFDPRWRVN